MTPQEQYAVFQLAPREDWAKAEDRLFSGSNIGKKARYRPADRTDQLCLKIHKQPSEETGVVELSPISSTGRIDHEKRLPFDVLACFLHKPYDIVYYKKLISPEKANILDIFPTKAPSCTCVA